MAGFYSARGRIILPLPWPTFAPPLSIKAVVDISGQGLGKLALAQAVKSIDGQPPEGIRVPYDIDVYKSADDGKAWLKAHADGIP